MDDTTTPPKPIKTVPETEPPKTPVISYTIAGKTDRLSEKRFSFVDFYPEMQKDRAEGMALALNWYLNCGFDWKIVIKEKVICRDTLYQYLKHECFRAAIKSLDQIKEQTAESVYFQALTDAPWPEKIKAADRITGAANPGRWDLGVRREVIRAGLDFKLGRLKELQARSKQAIDITQEITEEEMLDPGSEDDR